MGFLFFLVLALFHWTVSGFDPSSYSENYEVPLSGVTVYWAFNATDIRLALRAQTFRTAAEHLSQQQQVRQRRSPAPTKTLGGRSPLQVPRTIPKGYGAGLGGR